MPPAPPAVRPEARPPSTPPPATVPGAALPDALPPPPEVLEIVYRVERVATGVVDTEHRLVRAPFEVRIETHRIETHRAEPGDADLEADPTILDIAVLGGAETGPVDQERALVVLPPAPALRGAHLGTDVAAAEEAGVLAPLGFGREIAAGQGRLGGRVRQVHDDESPSSCVPGTAPRPDGGFWQPPLQESWTPLPGCARWGSPWAACTRRPGSSWSSGSPTWPRPAASPPPSW